MKFNLLISGESLFWRERIITLKQTQREKGRVMMTRRKEEKVRKRPKGPRPPQGGGEEEELEDSESPRGQI